RDALQAIRAQIPDVCRQQADPIAMRLNADPAEEQPVENRHCVASGEQFTGQDRAQITSASNEENRTGSSHATMLTKSRNQRVSPQLHESKGEWHGMDRGAGMVPPAGIEP